MSNVSYFEVRVSEYTGEETSLMRLPSNVHPSTVNGLTIPELYGKCCVNPNWLTDDELALLEQYYQWLPYKCVFVVEIVRLAQQEKPGYLTQQSKAPQTPKKQSTKPVCPDAPRKPKPLTRSPSNKSSSLFTPKKLTF